MSDSKVYSGNLTPEVKTGEYNRLRYQITQILAGVHTSTLVQIVSCTNSGGVSPVGFVDVRPLVNQMDASDHAIPHGVIHGLPYTRIQGGNNAIIMDPEPDDIGIAIFAERDISSVKANKAQSNPGSYRRFDWSDGVYIGGLLNGTPTQYVQFSAAGINLTSPVHVSINAPSTSFPQDVDISGTLTVAGIDVNTHDHSDPQGGVTGPME